MLIQGGGKLVNWRKIWLFDFLTTFMLTEETTSGSQASSIKETFIFLNDICFGEADPNNFKPHGNRFSNST